jgi:hypothetical protein
MCVALAVAPQLNDYDQPRPQHHDEAKLGGADIAQ